LLGNADLLPVLFGEVVIPRSVLDELAHPHSPEEVRQWISAPPPWARVLAATNIDRALPLGAGEREAIALAAELKADLLLADDKKARRFAEERGIRVAGTLGLLRIAHDRGLVDLPTAIHRLLRAGFRASDKLVQELITDETRGRSVGE
jgi:predicted nucleic acid-binding protein